MRKLLLSLTTIALLLPAFATPSAAYEPSELVSAAEAAGAPIYPEELMVMVHGQNTFAVAPVQGFENAPAGDLAHGSDMAFAYINFPGSTIPAGNYLLRARAPESGIRFGEYEGTLEFVDVDGAVVATLPLKMNTFSMMVPDPLPYPRTVIVGAWKNGAEPEISPTTVASSVKAAPSRHGRPDVATGNLIYTDPWKRDRGGWPIRYALVQWECPNGTVFESWIQIL